MKEYERGYKAGLAAAAKIAEEFEDVNWEACGDEVERGAILVADDSYKSSQAFSDGTKHAWMATASKAIAKMIKKARVPTREKSSA